MWVCLMHNKHNTTKETAKKNTARYRFFITITNIKQNKPSLTPTIVIERLLSLRESKILVTTETHHSKKDIHYHILIQTKEGLSKNTYRKDIEKLFPEFEKAHAIKREGVKSLANTINYIIKEIPPMTALNFFEKGTTDELLITNITPHELKTNAKKSLIMKDIQVIQQIIEYKEIKEWARRTLRTVRLYTRKKRIIRAL